MDTTVTTCQQCGALIPKATGADLWQCQCGFMTPLAAHARDTTPPEVPGPHYSDPSKELSESNPRAFSRTGECNRCGRCCRYLQFQIPNGPGLDEFFLARGLPPAYSEDGKTAYIVIKHHCPNLYRDGGIDNPSHWSWRCRLHGTRDKPEVCKAGPFGPRDTPAACGFRWEQ